MHLINGLILTFGIAPGLFFLAVRPEFVYNKVNGYVYENIKYGCDVDRSLMIIDNQSNPKQEIRDKKCKTLYLDYINPKNKQQVVDQKPCKSVCDISFDKDLPPAAFFKRLVLFENENILKDVGVENADDKCRNACHQVVSSEGDANHVNDLGYQGVGNTYKSEFYKLFQ